METVIKCRKLDPQGVVIHSARFDPQELAISRKSSDVQLLTSKSKKELFEKKSPDRTLKKSSSTLSKQASRENMISPTKTLEKQKSPDLKKKKSKTSKPPKSVINVQQQIIIQQQINNSPSTSTIVLNNEQRQTLQKLAKKKKKKHQPKSKTLSQNDFKAMHQHKKSDSLREQHVQILIENNLQEFKKQLEQKKLEQELERQRVASLQDMKKFLDFEIRKANFQRFAKKRKNLTESLAMPWGMNQQKLKQFWGKMIQIHENLQRPQQQIPEQQLSVKEKQRRQKLGVGFLNNMPEAVIKKIVHKHKQQVQLTDSNIQTEKMKLKKLSQEEENDVKLFMQYKQQFWKQKKLQERLEEFHHKERLKSNLTNLFDQIRQKQRQFSLSSFRKHSSNYSKKKSSSMIKQEFFPTQDLEKNYEQLQKEYSRLFNWRSISQKESRTQSDHQMIQNKTTKKKTPTQENQQFIQWLKGLPEDFLQEQLNQMQLINEEMNKQGFNYVLSEEEYYHFLEQFLKERFKEQKVSVTTTTTLNKNDDIKERFSQLQERFRNTLQQASQNSYQNDIQNQVKQQPDEIDFQIENFAATMIQKVWRGFTTRKQVFQYLQYLIEEQEEDQLQQQESLQEIQNCQENKSPVISQQVTHQSEEIQSQQQEIKIPDSRDSDIQKLKTTQISQWESIINSLKQFKQSNSSLQQEALFFIEHLEKQSELNKKVLAGELQESILISPPPTLVFQQPQIIYSAPQIFEQQLIAQNQEIKQLEQSESLQAIDLNKSAQSQNKKSVLDPDQFMNLLKINEERLEQKYQQQVIIMEKMLEKKKVTNQQFQSNIAKLNKKKLKEQKKLMQTKTEVERLQELFKDTIKQTQKDHDFFEKMKKYDRSLYEEENMSIRQIFSLRSESEQSECGEPQSNDKKSALSKVVHNDFDIGKNNGIFKKKNERFNVCQSGSSFDNVSNSIEQFHKNTTPTSKQFQQTDEILLAREEDEQIIIEQENQLPPQVILTIEEEQLNESLNQNKNNQLMTIDDTSEKQISSDNEERVEFITEFILQQALEDFATELNQFPLTSLGVLMEWDDESELEILESKLIPGFQTTLNFIKDYLIAFSDFIQKNCLQQFLTSINSPLGISAQDLLKTISLNEISSGGLDESQSSPLYPLIKHIHMMEPVIDEEIWEQFNLSYASKLKYLNHPEIDIPQMKELESFHLRMIFESFNEALNYIRPFGTRGQPYPWKNNPLKVYAHTTNMENIEKAMGFAVAKMLKWGAFLCGFIPEKIETPQGEIIVIEDDYLNQIKEDRLQQMLENEIQENEEKWLSYEEEQAEVCVELADIVFELMLDEASEDLWVISQNKQQKMVSN